MLGVEGVSSEADMSKVKCELTDEEIELDLRNNVPPIIPIRCGTLTAKMHVKLFVCPGIHQHCIELEHEPDLITPKAFTIRANKDRQKDWKGSIRIGKSNLRTLMEMRTFDFHNHSSFCSAKCQSRNYITPKESTLALDKEETTLLRRASVGATPTFVASPSKPEIKPTLGALFKNPQFSQFIQLSQALRNNNNVGSTSSSTSNSPQTARTSALLAGIQKFTKEEQGKITLETDLLCAKMTSDPIFFWSEMQHLGLSEQIIDQMVDQLNQMRTKLKNGSITNVAPFLSRSIASLGVCDRVVAAVRRRNSINAEAMHRLSIDYSSPESSTEFIKARPQSITEQLEALLVKKPIPQANQNGSRKKSIADSLEALVARKASLAQKMVKIEPPELSVEEKPIPTLNSTRKRSIDEQLEVMHAKRIRNDKEMNFKEFMKTWIPPPAPSTSLETSVPDNFSLNQLQSSSEILMQLAASINPTPTSNQNPPRDSLLAIK